MKKSEKDKYQMISLICWISKTKQTYKQQNRNRLTDTESKLVVARGEVSGGLGEIGEGD